MGQMQENEGGINSSRCFKHGSVTVVSGLKRYDIA
jgi:hypothetical protein